MLGLNSDFAMERAAAAFVGYCIGAVVVLPFDRLKTIMQVEARTGCNISSVAAFKQVLRNQGVRGLYQGFNPHMLIAPFTMLYFSIYDELAQRGAGNPAAPLYAAVVARTLETSARMPLELVRTQMQAASGTVTFTQCLRAQWHQPGHLWFRGFVPTLLRDVPFSAIYWVTYEYSKNRLKTPTNMVSNDGFQRFVHGFNCGAFAGMVAALATTPTDVIKTVKQHHVEVGNSPTYVDILREIIQNPRLAFAGVGPRLVRIPLGLSTMMAGLEVTRWAFEERRRNKS